MKHVGPISGIATNDKYVATAGYDSNLIVWDKNTQAPLKIFRHESLVNQCEFSSCGRYLVSSSSDYSARIWSLDEMRLVKVFANDIDDVEHSSFSPNSKHLATGSLSGRINIYNLESGEICTVKAHSPYVKSLAWDQNGIEFLSCGEDGEIKKWNLNNLDNPVTLSINENHTDTVINIGLGEFLAGNDNGELVLISNNDTLINKAHGSGIKRLSFCSVSQRIVSVGYDNIAKIWNYKNRELLLLSKFEIDSIVWTRSCAFLDENIIVFGTFGSSYAKYDLSKRLWDISKVENIVSINSITFHNGDLYSVGDSGVVKKNGKELSKVDSLCNFVSVCESGVFVGGHTGEIFEAITREIIYKNDCPYNSSLIFNLSGEELLVAADYNGQITVLNLKNKRVRKIKIFENAIKSIAFRDGVIAAVCANGEISTINALQNFRCHIVSGAHKEVANDISYIESESFCTVGRDKKLIIWKRLEFEVITTPHSNSIKAVGASSRYVCTGSYSGQIYVYDLVERRWCYSSRVSSWGISSIVFNESSEGFFIGSYDGKVYERKLEEICK